MPSVDDLNRMVREAFGSAQESLVRLEEAARDNDRTVLHTLSQAYARILSPLRDYLASVNMGRPLPRQLAKRVAEHIDAIFEFPQEVETMGLQPDGNALTRLIDAAEKAT